MNFLFHDHRFPIPQGCWNHRKRRRRHRYKNGRNLRPQYRSHSPSSRYSLLIHSRGYKWCKYRRSCTLCTACLRPILHPFSIIPHTWQSSPPIVNSGTCSRIHLSCV
jgi:hypothetical protein